MLKLRIITAVILLPFVWYAFVYGPPLFVILFFLVCCALCSAELSWMLSPVLSAKLRQIPSDIGKVQQDSTPVFSLINVGLSSLLFLLLTFVSQQFALSSLAAFLLFVIPLGLFSSRKVSIEQGVARVLTSIISVCYGTFPWVIAWQLYNMAPKSLYPILVMAITWMGDTGGYFGGRYLGGKMFPNKYFAPKISPKKTWEGSITGLSFSVLGAIGTHLAYKGGLGSLFVVVTYGIAGGIAAQAGDLIESAFKRFAGVKDSGTIIPGHGGFLDRIDGIIYCVPVVWVLSYLFT